MIYKAQRLQNKTETAIKRQKEIESIAKAAEDEDLRREAQYKLNLLTDKYAKLCKASGLPTRMERIKVAGFRNVKAVDKSAPSGIIRTVKTTTEVKEVQYVGKIDRKLIEKEFGEIQTDEVVLTIEREAHIKDGHLIDFELFERYRAAIINSPNIVLKDVKNENTIFMVKRLGETNINIVVKIAVVGDEKHPKNSIMTSYRIRNRNLKKLEEKNKVLYKSE